MAPPPPRGLIVTLFHLFFVPIVWAVVLSMAVRTDYAPSPIESMWMAVDLVAAFCFRIGVTMELCWGFFILKFMNYWTSIGAMSLVAQRVLVEMKLAEDSKYWCFLLFILIGYYEIIAFLALCVLRIVNIDNKHSEIQADPESAKVQANPERAELQAYP